MNTLRIWAVTRKEFIHIIRDPRSLGMSIAIPMLLLLLFGYALTLDVDNVPMVIWDQDGTQASREFISRFAASPYFSLQEYVTNYQELEGAVDSGRALAALVIPAGFAGRIDSGREAQVQLIVDGSDSNTSTIAIGYADAVAMIYSQDVALKEIRRMGKTKMSLPLEVQSRVWFNPDLESKNYIIPGNPVDDSRYGSKN